MNLDELGHASAFAGIDRERVLHDESESVGTALSSGPMKTGVRWSGSSAARAGERRRRWLPSRLSLASLPGNPAAASLRSCYAKGADVGPGVLRCAGFAGRADMEGGAGAAQVNPASSAAERGQSVLIVTTWSRNQTRMISSIWQWGRPTRRWRSSCPSISAGPLAEALALPIEALASRSPSRSAVFQLIPRLPLQR
jgi:hypothetical protein